MKYLVICNDIKSIESLSKYCDGFILESHLFSCRKNHDLTIKQINELSLKLVSLKKEVILNMNIPIFDDDFKQIDEVLSKINLNNISKIIVSDLGLLNYLKKSKINNIVLNQKTLATNSFDFNYYKNFGAIGSFLGEELNRTELISLTSKKEYLTFFNGFSYHLMFVSRRPLITNYYKQIKEKNTNSTFTLTEEIRPDEHYHILEDEYGTHFFKDKISVIIDDINNFDIDYLVLDGLFIEDDVLLDALKLYQGVIKKDTFFAKYPNLNFDNGFLDKSLVYRKEKND